MSPLPALGAALALLSLPAAAIEATPGMPEQPPLALVGVHLLTMETEQVLRERTVIVREGRIASIAPGDAGQIPADAVVIEGNGRYLMPGLAEMHAHLPPARSGDASRERVMKLFLVNGVTTVRGMLGAPAHLRWRDAVAAYEMVGPRIYTSGPSFSGRSVSSPQQAAERVRKQHAAGYDFLKLHPGLTLAEFDAIAASADAVGIDFAGHVSLAVGVERALAAGQATIDHLDGYMQALVPADAAAPADAGFFGARLAASADPQRLGTLVAATRRAGVWNVPTQSLIENVVLPEAPAAVAARPEMRYVPADLLERWRAAKAGVLADETYDAQAAQRFVELRRRLIVELHRAGAGLLLGSDAPQIFNVPGFSLHRELQILVDAGLTPYEALATGTVNAARYLGADGDAGVLRIGLAADLVMVDGNPLEDIANAGRIAAVVARGRWLPRETLDGWLRALER